MHVNFAYLFSEPQRTLLVTPLLRVISLIVKALNVTRLLVKLMT